MAEGTAWGYHRRSGGRAGMERGMRVVCGGVGGGGGRRAGGLWGVDGCVRRVRG